MSELPPKLEGFAYLLNAQTQPVREVFQYCLCLKVVEVGKMGQINTTPGETTTICTLE